MMTRKAKAQTQSQLLKAEYLGIHANIYNEAAWLKAKALRATVFPNEERTHFEMLERRVDGSGGAE